MPVHRKSKAVTIVGLAHGLQTAGHSLRVTVLTTWADFRAASERVPGGFGPFDRGIRRHITSQ